MRAAGGVDEDGVAIGHFLHGGDEFGGGEHDFERDADDVGVGAELIDGGDAVGVDGDEADFLALPQFECGGELGDGGGFADAGGADEADAAAADAGGRACDGIGQIGGQELLEFLREAVADAAGVGKLIGGEFRFDIIDDADRDFFADLLLDELHVHLAELLWQILRRPPALEVRCSRLSTMVRREESSLRSSKEGSLRTVAASSRVERFMVACVVRCARFPACARVGRLWRRWLLRSGRRRAADGASRALPTAVAVPPPWDSKAPLSLLRERLTAAATGWRGLLAGLHVHIHAGGDFHDGPRAEPHQAAGFEAARVQDHGVAAKLLLDLRQRFADGGALKRLHVHPVTPTMPTDSTFMPLTISLYDRTATAGSDGSISFRTKLRTCGEQNTTPPKPCCMSLLMLRGDRFR